MACFALDKPTARRDTQQTMSQGSVESAPVIDSDDRMVVVQRARAKGREAAKEFRTKAEALDAAALGRVGEARFLTTSSAPCYFLPRGRSDGAQVP